jgi:hypothetical protein
LRKRRTRSHVLAELSANHVERFALLCGYSVERVAHDYGIDLVLTTFDANGEIENGSVYLQLKATDAPTLLADNQTIALPLERAHLEYWLQEAAPVILIVYDAQAETAYWLYIQAYFEGQTDFDLISVGSTVTVHVDKSHVLDQTAIRQFARFRDAVQRQIEGIIRHHA